MVWVLFLLHTYIALFTDSKCLTKENTTQIPIKTWQHGSDKENNYPRKCKSGRNHLQRKNGWVPIDSACVDRCIRGAAPACLEKKYSQPSISVRSTFLYPTKQNYSCTCVEHVQTFVFLLLLKQHSGTACTTFTLCGGCETQGMVQCIREEGHNAMQVRNNVTYGTLNTCAICYRQGLRTNAPLIPRKGYNIKTEVKCRNSITHA